MLDCKLRSVQRDSSSSPSSSSASVGQLPLLESMLQRLTHKQLMELMISLFFQTEVHQFQQGFNQMGSREQSLTLVVSDSRPGSKQCYFSVSAEVADPSSSSWFLLWICVQYHNSSLTLQQDSFSLKFMQLLL